MASPHRRHNQFNTLTTDSTKTLIGRLTLHYGVTQAELLEMLVSAESKRLGLQAPEEAPVHH